MRKWLQAHYKVSAVYHKELEFKWPYLKKRTLVSIFIQKRLRRPQLANHLAISVVLTGQLYGMLSGFYQMADCELQNEKNNETRGHGKLRGKSSKELGGRERGKGGKGERKWERRGRWERWRKRSRVERVIF